METNTSDPGRLSSLQEENVFKNQRLKADTGAGVKKTSFGSDKARDPGAGGGGRGLMARLWAALGADHSVTLGHSLSNLALPLKKEERG